MLKKGCINKKVISPCAQDGYTTQIQHAKCWNEGFNCWTTDNCLGSRTGGLLSWVMSIGSTHSEIGTIICAFAILSVLTTWHLYKSTFSTCVSHIDTNEHDIFLKCQDLETKTKQHQSHFHIHTQTQDSWCRDNTNQACVKIYQCSYLVSHHFLTLWERDTHSSMLRWFSKVCIVSRPQSQCLAAVNGLPHTPHTRLPPMGLCNYHTGGDYFSHACFVFTRIVL